MICWRVKKLQRSCNNAVPARVGGTRPNQLASGTSQHGFADAIGDSYPNRAIDVWKQLTEAQIAQTSPSAYQVAAGYLRKLGRPLERQGKSDEWRNYLSELREGNKRKCRLLEILDGLVE